MVDALRDALREVAERLRQNDDEAVAARAHLEWLEERGAHLRNAAMSIRALLMDEQPEQPDVVVLDDDKVVVAEVKARSPRTLKDAIVLVLADAGQPLTAQRVMEQLGERGWFTTSTLNSVYEATRRLAVEGHLVVRTGRNAYAHVSAVTDTSALEPTNFNRVYVLETPDDDTVPDRLRELVERFGGRKEA